MNVWIFKSEYDIVEPNVVESEIVESKHSHITSCQGDFVVYRMHITETTIYPYSDFAFIIKVC